MPEVIIPGPEGRIEGRYHHAEKAGSPIALVLHPHPQHGGTMNNKITYTLFHAFVKNGFSVLRFNFRGVGKSQGKYDGGIGEMSDAASALDWLQLQNPEAASSWISGFSFGSWIAMHLLMRRPEIEGFISVSPPVGMFDFNFLNPCPCSGMVAMGEADQLIRPEDVTRMVSRISQQKNIDIDYRQFAGADHFYHGQIDELSAHLDDYLFSRREEFSGKRQPRNEKKRRQLPRG